jgi:replicative DNA helicase
MNNIREAVLGHVKAGHSIIPLTENDKRPDPNLLPKLHPKDDPSGPVAGRWHPFQVNPPTEQEVLQWLDGGMTCFAIVCGKVSGGLVTIDFDSARFFDEWMARVTATDLCIQKSGRDGGGYHVRFKVPDKEYRSDKLAYFKDDSKVAGRAVAIEIKGESSYAVAAPSIHSSGRPYKVIHGDIHKIPVITSERADRLIQAARELDEEPLTRQQIAAEAKRLEQSSYVKPVNTSIVKPTSTNDVIGTFNSKFSISDVLARCGYVHQSGNRWIPPGGKRGLVVTLDDKAYSHNSDDIISDGHAHDAFSVFCTYNHGGDYGSAVKEAANMLGLKRNSPSTANSTTTSQPEAASDNKTIVVAENESNETEERLIGLFLSNREAIRIWTGTNITSNYFSTPYANLVAGIIYSFNNGVQLTKSAYTEFLKQYKGHVNDVSIDKEITTYTKCVNSIVDMNDLPILLERLRSGYVSRKTDFIISHHQSNRIKNGDLGANRFLIDGLSSLEADASESQVKLIELHKSKQDFLDKLYERRNNPDSRLICGIPEIDETMNVGFKVGHLTMFCADVGSFKTTMMVNIALNLFKQSQQQANILYIPLEMPGDEIIQKIVARETQIPFNLIEHAEKLSEEQIKMIGEEMDKWHNLQHRFCILEAAERTKVSQIRREIEKRINYFKPRMVFIDYADNLLPDNQRSRSDEQMNDTLEDLRKMGKALGFGIVSAAQLSRDALKKLKESSEKNQRITSTDIRGGQVMAANSDTVYAQWRNPAQPSEELVFTCIKARHGKNMFHNDRDKTILKVRADIGLIESPNGLGWNGNADDPLLKGLNSPPPIGAAENLPEDEEDGSPF